ncbi:MAG: hypothetical protein CSA70_10960 [Rhodobacterales bacterium]|nr:MAG: hypothetical protein CSA70_10960 [Rhodobacterales bacterium]
MFVMDVTFFALAIPAVVFAGVSKGGFGSGAAFASATILALVVEPGVAVGVMLPLLMLIDAASLRPYWRKWSGAHLRLLLLGGVPGTALGALFFRAANDDLLRLLLGGISLGFVLWQVVPFARARRAPFPPWGGVLAGIVGGFTSFVAHAGGPPVAVYMLSQNVGKTRYQATSVILFWVLNILKFVPYSFLGIFTAQTLWADLWLSPFAVLGAWIGVRAHFLISDRAFFGLTYVLLTLTGSKLIWDALT